MSPAMMPFVVDPGWYRAHWYGPQPVRQAVWGDAHHCAAAVRRVNQAIADTARRLISVFRAEAHKLIGERP
jgi:hypothetical protein